MAATVADTCTESQLDLGIMRRVVYELELPLSALDWCKQNFYQPVRFEKVLTNNGSIFTFVVLQFNTRKAARAVALAYDVAEKESKS